MSAPSDVDVAAVTHDRIVTFSSNIPGVKRVTPYSELYGIHPRLIVATHKGWKLVSDHADPSTGKSPRIDYKRRSNLITEPRVRAITAERHKTINAVYQSG